MLNEDELEQAEYIAATMPPSWEKGKIIKFSSYIRTLQQQNKQLQEENERLMMAEEEYKALQKIMDRARKLAFMVEEEERPRFRMDANGNLTRIEDDES